MSIKRLAYAKVAAVIALYDSLRAQLEQWFRAQLTPKQVVLCSRILLMAASGKGDFEIAEELEVKSIDIFHGEANLMSSGYDASGTFVMIISSLWPRDFTHDIIIQQAKDLDEGVNGVSGHSALGPAPVIFFYEGTGRNGQLEITDFVGRKAQVALLKQGNQVGLPDHSDLFLNPRSGGPAFFEIESGDGVAMFFR